MKKPTNLILVIIAVGLFYTVTSPQYRKVQVLNASKGEYENVLENAARIAETRDRLLVDYNTIPKAELDRLSKAIPDNIDVVRLALDLDTISTRYGVSIKNVQAETGSGQNAAVISLPENAVPYDKATVSFSFVSNYSTFMKILSDLERSLRIMDVQSVAFTVSDSGLYEHKLTVETYWLK